MTSYYTLEQHVDYMIEAINGVRYDEDGEVVSTASRTVPVAKDFFVKFDEIKWEIATRIGYDNCCIHCESDDCVIYEIVSDDYGVEYVKIKLGEEYEAIVTFFSAVEMI